MPAIEWHAKTSLEQTGKDHRNIHEWLDGDQEKKAERHDITRIYEHGRMIEEKFGVEARQAYVQHLHDDVKAKFNHILHELEKTVAETLAYFGVR